MSRLTAIRTKLTNKVFNTTLGTDVTITPVTNAGDSTDGGFNPDTMSEGTAVTVKGIPYSNTVQDLFKQMFGDANLAEGTVILPYDTSVSAGDKIVWLSNTYYVESVEDFILGGGVVAKQVLVNERLS